MTDHAPPIIEQADALYDEGSLDDALEAYRQALTADPTSAWAHSRAGAILAQLGDMAGAERSLSDAIRLDPALPQAHSNLGNVFFSRNDFDAAIEKYKEAARLSPQNPLYHENLHAAYRKKGLLSEAVAAMKQAHRLQRDTGRAEAKDRVRRVGKGIQSRVGCLLPACITVGAVFAILD